MSKTKTRAKHIPKVSVVLASYNGEKYISQSIESILNQSFRDFELILIDDGSTDNTLFIMEKFANKDQRIKIIKHQVRTRLASSLNEGIRVAKGLYIARMDDDDISEKNRFKKEIELLDENPNIFLVGTAIYKVNESNELVGTYFPPTNFNDISNLLESSNIMVHPTIMFRKNPAVFYRDKFWSVQDYDFFLRIKDMGLKIANISEPLLRYRVASKHTDISRMVIHSTYNYYAKLFHIQRIQAKKDMYFKLNPQKLEATTINNLSQPDILYDVIFSLLKMRKKKEATKYYIIFLKKFGANYKIIRLLPYFLFPSFLRSFITSLRKR